MFALSMADRTAEKASCGDARLLSQPPLLRVRSFPGTKLGSGSDPLARNRVTAIRRICVNHHLAESGLTPIADVLSTRAQKLAPRSRKMAPETVPDPLGGNKTRGTSKQGRGRPPKATEQIEAVVEQISGEFHDGDHLPSNIGQAARLWKASGLSEAAFVSRLFEARSITKQRGDIKKRASGEAGEWGMRNRMPYYFAVVRDLLGMKEAEAP